LRPIALISIAIVAIAIIAIGLYLYLQRYFQKPIEIGIPIPSELYASLVRANKSIIVESPEFRPNETIPTAFTCDGSDISPPLIIEGVPPQTVSIAIIVYDPDALGRIFYHWLLYSIKPSSRIEIPASIPMLAETKIGLQGYNDFGRIGYGGPCPPKGDKPHRYIFMVLALDIDIKSPGLKPSEFLREVNGHIVAYGYTIGIYKRD